MHRADGGASLAGEDLEACRRIFGDAAGERRIEVVPREADVAEHTVVPFAEAAHGAAVLYGAPDGGDTGCADLDDALEAFADRLLGVDQIGGGHDGNPFSGEGPCACRRVCRSTKGPRWLSGHPEYARRPLIIPTNVSNIQHRFS
jgi:hypothetical protein